MELLYGTVLPTALIGTGLFFLCFLHPFSSDGKRERARRPREKKTQSPVKAMTVALAGTLGVGNIVGVASAILAGGPGALFWMWAAGWAVMAVKYAEVVLGVRFRHFREGKPYGGAPYYIRDGMAKRIGEKPSAVLGGIFAVFCVANALTTGNLVQMNAVGDVLPTLRLPIGIAVAVAVGAVAFGGAGRIGEYTSRLIPLLTGAYLALIAYMLASHASELGTVIAEMMKDAFDFRSAAGGTFGFCANRAIRYGTVRGALSNEAGCGTSPTAHASADTNDARRQGRLGIFEVFCDTVLVCGATGLVLLVFMHETGRVGTLSPMALALSCFAAYGGKTAAVFLRVAVLLFAFSTLLCQCYYGEEAVRYLTPKRTVKTLYRVLFLATVVAGVLISPSLMWQLSDLVIAVMTLVNLTCLVCLRREIKKPF